MDRTYRCVVGCLLVLGAVLAASCSEDSVTSSSDTLGPSVAFLHPISTAGKPQDVSDSLDIFVRANDDHAVAKVEIWGILENREDPEQIATLSAPLTPEQIPDTLEVPAGASVYGSRWFTQRIRNGTKVRLFSRAFDEAGNATRTDLVYVRILNRGVPLTPPSPQIVVTPSSGIVDDFFTFDASATRDSIDTPDRISVRWDFDGDGTWDRDWADGVLASVPQQFKYSRAGLYSARIEAKNTYLPDVVGTASRQVLVTNKGGEPHPPEPENMVLIPAGIYRVGTADTTIAERDEVPVHTARLTSDFYIERTEVSNRLYLQYLKSVMSGVSPRVRREGNIIRFFPNKAEPVEDDSLPEVLVDLAYSKLFYDPDGDTIAVPPEARVLPAVGISWFGAKAYAENYGLRLPTEHEWEIAAKADSVSWIYPWGTTITTDQANYLDSGFRAARPIGSYPSATSPFGLLDLSGNAAEWVKDWYDVYPSGALINPEGPFEQVDEKGRVIRGGSFLRSASGVRVTARAAGAPDLTSDQVGFRTAYTR